jgi:hypothetical protein
MGPPRRDAGYPAISPERRPAVLAALMAALQELHGNPEGPGWHAAAAIRRRAFQAVYNSATLSGPWSLCRRRMRVWGRRCVVAFAALAAVMTGSMECALEIGGMGFMAGAGFGLAAGMVETGRLLEPSLAPRPDFEPFIRLAIAGACLLLAPGGAA